jgi:hypothetical protein
MATAFVSDIRPSGTVPFTRDQPFFLKLSAAIALFIIFAFAQFGLRGLSSPFTAPVWVHLHGVAMLGWLGTLVTQNALARGAHLSVHRKLGWIAAVLVAAIVFLGCYTGVRAIELHRQPPFIAPAYFHALTWVESLAFGLMVAAGIALRRRTQWHRRLLIGATIVILEPALGRVLPVPLLGDWNELTVLLCQLGVVAVMGAHDRKVLGRVLPATWWVAGAIVAIHVAVVTLARTPAVIVLASSLAGG